MKIIHGVDIVKISRISNLYRKYDKAFLYKLFTDGEIDYLSRKDYKIESMAGIFASKEAMSKAVGSGIGKLSWKDIEIFHDSLGKPRIRLLKDMGLDIESVELSISHDGEYAIASIVGFCI